MRGTLLSRVRFAVFDFGHPDSRGVVTNAALTAAGRDKLACTSLQLAIFFNVMYAVLELRDRHFGRDGTVEETLLRCEGLTMTYKSNLSRIARLEAGCRLSMPGQDPVREQELRTELTQELQPRGHLEKIWIEDIAYRIAAIEVIRSQIAGCRTRLVQAVLADIERRAHEFERNRELFLAAGEDKLSDISAAERAVLEQCGHYGTTPVPLTNWLSQREFAWLLGKLGPKELHLLRQFQMHEHEEVRERDRIINQFERRRRQVVWDAVELAQARRRAGLSELEEVLVHEVRSDLRDQVEQEVDAGFTPIEGGDLEGVK